MDGTGARINGIAFVDTGSINPVPVPAAVWLFGTALIGFIGVSRRRKVT
ncbi:MAG: VPLPA-CTERM sorting domain-containing protein [bacterium]